MTNRRREKLNIVPPPAGGPVLTAPPVLNASSHTTDYVCGNCGEILLHADEGQVHNLVILCASCGSFNSTDP